MSKHIHIHIGSRVRDASWSESKRFPEGTMVRIKPKYLESNPSFPKGIGESTGTLVRGMLTVYFAGRHFANTESIFEKA